MGAGSKTAHASYSVVPAKSATVLVAVPETDEPFWANGAAPDDTDGAWAAAGFGPEEAQAWHHAGFGPGGAAAFCASGIELPPLAAAWVGAGFGPEEAQAWHHAGFEPAGAVAWAGIGFDAEEAAEALAQGKSPAAYLADQVEPPADALLVVAPAPQAGLPLLPRRRHDEDEDGIGRELLDLLRPVQLYLQDEVPRRVEIRHGGAVQVAVAGELRPFQETGPVHVGQEGLTVDEYVRVLRFARPALAGGPRPRQPQPRHEGEEAAHDGSLPHPARARDDVDQKSYESFSNSFLRC